MTQGTYLKALRKRAKLNQEDAAKRIGVERGYLSRLEREKVGIGQKLAPKIAQAYDEPLKRVERFVRTNRTEAGALLERVEELAQLVADLADQQSAARSRLDLLEAQRSDPEARQHGGAEAS